ncbi:MAG: FeoA family protein [Anaerolineae bacterium]|uniref:FeoA family protein n=1 Tax=Candidatus Amarolinea dominans TaxID=3140696 RepID=UPI001DFDFBFB|nr:ferrous iron transport protein A [Anaerolineae bacterium]MBK7203167.1 ferrous iron transport protein A [Anaerolineae bacterium]MBK9233701.1 ferrous iron transport protein A [Anaerolineae bacterium]MBK9234153.1 ferrous iron transport protein A [Anaerolineae bacterium]
MRLNELQPGQRGIIRRIGGIGAFRRRLLDMGLLPGEEIAVIRLAPLGSPTEYRIKNYHLALRPHDASFVDVEMLS